MTRWQQLQRKNFERRAGSCGYSKLRIGVLGLSGLPEKGLGELGVLGLCSWS